MGNIDNIKDHAAKVRQFWNRIGLCLLAIIAIADLVFGLRNATLFIAPTAIVIIVISTVRHSRATGDEYQIFMLYRLLAISMGFSVLCGFTASALAERGFEIGISQTSILLYSALASLAAVSLFDWYAARGDAKDGL